MNSLQLKTEGRNNSGAGAGPVILWEVPQTRMGTWTILQTDLVASAATYSVQEKSTAFSLHILTRVWLSNM